MNTQQFSRKPKITLKEPDDAELAGLVEQQVHRMLTNTNETSSTYLLPVTELRRLERQVSKLRPIFSEHQIQTIGGQRLLTLCELRGKNAVLATGYAWKCPTDAHVPAIGMKLSFSRAVRTFVARRIGLFA